MSQIELKKAAGFLLAGALVGAGVALLYAPQSGRRTRKDVKRFARTTADRLDDLQTDIRDQARNWVEDMSEAIKDGVGRGKELGAEAYAQVLQSFDSAKQCVEDGKSRIEKVMKEEIA
jgi:gas vesicle protein